MGTKRNSATSTRKIAKTTKKLFRELAKGKSFTQRQISEMMWKLNHGKDAVNETSAYSYWHGPLLGHVENKRIKKTKNRETGRIVYSITAKGQTYARRNNIVKA